MQPIYVEVSDEITTVIERMKASENAAIALVVPKGAVLLQSIVNLKLAKKAALDAGKELTLVTTDKIGRNLAAQVGLSVVSRLDEKGMAVPEETTLEEGEPTIIDGVKIHRYYTEEDQKDEESTPEIEPIVPREIMKEMPTKESALDNPIIVRQISTEPVITAAAVAPTPVVMPEIISPKPDPLIALELTEPTPTPPSSPNRKLKKLGLLISYLLILSLLGAVGVGAFYYPKTNVSLVVNSKPWEKQLILAAKVGEKSTLSPQLLTTEVTESILTKATGTKEVGTKAVGSAKLFNGESSDPKVVPAGTQIVANGLTFLTQQQVTVPGARVQSFQLVAGSVNVNITAEQPGTGGNLSDTPATVPNQKLYAQIISTSGGTSKQVLVITSSDIANAKNAVIKKARESADAKVTSDLQNKNNLFDPKTDTFTYEGFNTTSVAGVESDTFTVSCKGILKRLTV